MFEIPATLLWILACAISFVLFVFFLYAAVQKFYVVPRADEVIVKTGGKEPTVHTGGVFVVPLIHTIKRMSTRSMRVPIIRKGADALPTADGIPAEITGELFVQIDPSESSNVILAARSLESEERYEVAIEKQIKSLVEDALRTAVFKKTFIALNAEKAEFAKEVLDHLQPDLLKLGLTLKSVTIPHVAQGQFSAGADDVIAAMGRKNVAMTVAENDQLTNKIRQEAAIKVKQQNLAARQQALEIEMQQKEAEAEQVRQVQEIEATKATEARKAVLSQEEARAIAEAEQQRAIQAAQIRESEKVQTTQIAQTQALTVQRSNAEAAQKVAAEQAAQKSREAEIAREQSVKVAAEKQEQAVAQAAIEKQVAVATSKQREAEARAAQAEAEAKQQEAEQAIVTVRTRAEADRQKQVVLIKADEEAGQAKIAADRDAYVATKRAEAERDAAEKRAEAQVAAARGANEASTISVQGDAANLLTKASAEAEASAKQAEARTKLAEAARVEGEAKAAAERALVEAKNAVAKELLLRDIALKALDVAPQVVREFMQPVTSISDVKILSIQGLGGEGDGVNVPANILGTGMALGGALPVLKEAVEGFTKNEDVQAISKVLKDVATETLRDTARAARGEAKATNGEA